MPNSSNLIEELNQLELKISQLFENIWQKATEYELQLAEETKALETVSDDNVPSLLVMSRPYLDLVAELENMQLLQQHVSPMKTAKPAHPLNRRSHELLVANTSQEHDQDRLNAFESDSDQDFVENDESLMILQLKQSKNTLDIQCRNNMILNSEPDIQTLEDNDVYENYEDVVEIDLSDLFEKSMDPSISSHMIKVPQHLVREWERNELEYQAFIERMRSLPPQQISKYEVPKNSKMSTNTSSRSGRRKNI